MIIPIWPDASRPGPSGPDRFSPSERSDLSAARASGVACASCHRISSSMVSGSCGLASIVARMAYAAAPRVCAPIWQTAEAWPAALAAATAAGVIPSRLALPPPKRRRISESIAASPRENALVRAIAARGLSSLGFSDSNKFRTRSAQSAAQLASRRRSDAVNV